MNNHQALFWEYDDKANLINCHLCPHHCQINDGKLGFCKTKKNINNTLLAMNYGRITSIAIDPIEKKPLYHYKPGSQILSIGTYGCNMQCNYCQNYSISQAEVDTNFYSPEGLVNIINSIDNNIGIAFTYNEPLMSYEYILDVAKLLKEKKLPKNIILVSNGYINSTPLENLLPYIDGVNIDLKTFRNYTYRKLCKASLTPILNTIKTFSNKCHMEVTTLIVTGENDSLEEVEEIARFLGKINPNIAFHLSRYFPNYRMKNDATDIKFMIKAQEVARQHLNYVYLGNIQSLDNNSYCHHCHHLLIERDNYQVKTKISNNKCPNCNKAIPFIV